MLTQLKLALINTRPRNKAKYYQKIITKKDFILFEEFDTQRESTVDKNFSFGENLIAVVAVKSSLFAAGANVLLHILFRTIPNFISCFQFLMTTS